MSLWDRVKAAVSSGREEARVASKTPGVLVRPTIATAIAIPFVGLLLIVGSPAREAVHVGAEIGSSIERHMERSIGVAPPRTKREARENAPAAPQQPGSESVGASSAPVPPEANGQEEHVPVKGVVGALDRVR
jgi:hypothetical protein